ncbi:MAG TPA: HAD family phosphatase [Candidatus Saccharimonadales bacterium]
MSKSFAVFDIDGTIIRWQLYHAIGDELARQGIIDPKEFQAVRAARMNWKRRSGAEQFHEYEMQLVRAFDRALPDLKVHVLSEAAEAVFSEYKEQVYTYTRDLIRDLKAKDYLLFAVSGSPEVIVEKLAAYYGFDDFAATNYPSKNGRFTGSKQLSLGKKPELLKELMKRHSAGLKHSVAVGDSEGDIDMLAMVEQPIAFNPSKQLFQHARQQGWPIVLERKNVVYKLEPADGTYRLDNN